MAELVGPLTDFYDTTGGIDTISSAISLGNTKLRDSQNVNYFPVGGYSWRNGYIKLNGSAFNSGASCTGLYQARFSNQTLTPIMVAGNKIGTISQSTGVVTDQTNGVTITASNNNLWTFDTLNDIVCGSNDVDTCLQMTSANTVTTLAGSPPFTSALFNLTYRGYMFWGQTVESGTRQYDRLRFSSINDPNTVGANNFIDVAKKNGGDIRGAVDYHTYLYAFKRHGIYQINYQPTRVNSVGVLFPFTETPNPVVPGVGTQSHRSIVKFTTPITNRLQAGKELVFFVDQFGVPRIFDGITTVQVGYPISNSRDTNILSLKDMDKTRIAQVWSVNYPEKNQVLCFMSRNNSQNDICWVLDYTVGFAWGRYKFAHNQNCGTLFEKSNGTFRPYFGDYAGFVREFDNGTNDDGSIINSYAIHGDVYNQSPSLNSSWLTLEFRGSTGSTSQAVSVDLYVNGDDTSARNFTLSLAKTQTTWGTTGTGGTMTWGTSNWAHSGLSNQVKELGFDAKTVRVKVSNSTLNNTLALEGFTLNSKPLGLSQQ